jgi:hypothetical protein
LNANRHVRMQGFGNRPWAVGRPIRVPAILILVLVTGTACSPEGIMVVNETDAPVDIVRTFNGVRLNTIKAGTEVRMQIPVAEDGCNPDLGYTALGPDGQVLATKGPTCEGDTWTIKE